MRIERRKLLSEFSVVQFEPSADECRNDSTAAYDIVVYFNAEGHEANRILKAIDDHLKADYKVMLSLMTTNTTQDIVFLLGLIVICIIAAYQVAAAAMDVGKFVTLITYMSQLQSSLKFFGTFYRKITTAMIKSERMLALFEERPRVVDKKNARRLLACEGRLCFKEVSFTYGDHEILRDLSFNCEPGTTTAFVGESGGGKSTVFRLLYRFYNIMSGNIQVDGHDVKDLTIDSVRSHIGVVPQDPILFNETLMYNLKYANPEATDEQVYEACRAARIHDKIMAFPDNYQTKVGDRGSRLSGGEKQRIAIARAILKNPRIILLDEATAALDAETEQHIQDAFTNLAKGRTMLIIAHRLSTIKHADKILVLHKGKVKEQGTHKELLAIDGYYASMWGKENLFSGCND
jgi:ABC-type transport system involved in Fe-S cluster assembly fused permease/ATPase subunit